MSSIYDDLSYPEQTIAGLSNNGPRPTSPVPKSCNTTHNLRYKCQSCSSDAYLQITSAGQKVTLTSSAPSPFRILSTPSDITRFDQALSSPPVTAKRLTSQSTETSKVLFKDIPTLNAEITAMFELPPGHLVSIAPIRPITRSKSPFRPPHARSASATTPDSVHARSLSPPPDPVPVLPLVPLITNPPSLPTPTEASLQDVISESSDDEDSPPLTATSEFIPVYAAIADFISLEADPSLNDDLIKTIKRLERPCTNDAPDRASLLQANLTQEVIHARSLKQQPARPNHVKMIFSQISFLHPAAQCIDAFYGDAHNCALIYPCPLNLIADFLSQPSSDQTKVSTHKFLERLLYEFLSSTASETHHPDIFKAVCDLIQSETIRKRILSSDSHSLRSRRRPSTHKRSKAKKKGFFKSLLS